jgi:predicted  nucleic acid-binding Zn-ribbon protein
MFTTNRTKPSSYGIVHRGETKMATCIRCGEFFPDERQDMGFYRCIPCNTQYAQARGEEIKKQSVPLNKSNYYYVSNAEMVKQLNPKRTT